MLKSNLISTVLAVALCTLTASAGMMGLGGLAVKKPHVFLGLPGVHVKVTFAGSKEIPKHSSTLTVQHIQATVESILRKKHITLFSDKELPSVPGKPVLHIQMWGTIEEQTGVAALSIRFRLTEEVVSLARNYELRTRAEIWAKNAIFAKKLDELEIDDYIKRRTVTFCDSYNGVNKMDAKDKKNDF